MFDNLFGGDESDDEDDTPVEDADREDEIPDELRAPTGEPYQITPTGNDRIGGAEVLTHTEENDVVAGPKVRQLIEGSRDRPKSPLWIGYNDSAQEGFREVPIEFDSLFQHNWVCGTTGAGKTTELLNWMVQLAYAGHGFVYFDPKARDSKELLQLLPEDRLDDVVWIEPGDEDFERDVGINFLEIPETDSQVELEREIEDRLENLKAILDNDDYWGPRMRAITDSMGRAMMKSDKDYSVIDFYFVLLNQERREQFAEEVEDPYIKEFVSEIAEMDDDAVRPLLSRVKNWVENGVIRRIIAQRESSIDFQEIIDENKIVIVRTPVSNQDVKQMITLGVMRPIWSAVQSRSFEDGENEPFFAIFDEFDAIASQNLDVKNMLARARSMKLSVTIACQYPEQLNEAGVLSAVKANCNNPVIFRLPNDEDARPVAKLFKGYTDEDLMETENWQVWTKIPIKGGMQYSDPLKIHTFAQYPPLRSEADAEEVICRSLEQYGSPPVTDAEIQRELPYGDLQEGTTPTSAAEIDTANDERMRDLALKAVFDTSIRDGNPRGFVPITACLDRLRRHLGVSNGLETSGKAWRHIFKSIPETHLDHEERDGDMYVKVLTKSFMQVGEKENDGSAEHWAPMEDAYVPLTQLGFIVDIPAQDTSDMPDATASVEDALNIPDNADNEEIADAVTHYREYHPTLHRLAGTKDVYIESEHTTGDSQPSQTVRNVMQAVNEGRRCLLVSREETAKRVHTTLLKEPKGSHKNHPVDGERRFYTLTSGVTIDGDAMTRPGSSNNVWVYEESSGEYVLRDDNGTEHARFESAEAIFEDETAYPMGGDRRIKAPIIPEYDTDMLDIIVVKEDAKTPADLLVYREDGNHVPLDMLVDQEEEQAESSDESGGDIIDALR
ncbi:type IV secretory system conjugative DNA transfer family protein [Haladaptatus pallidirubidus]|uniref:Type IV secretion-system coupling protein DNA-binding domain-containing protein n=1 Tax=Haladaptatus pallidirubidus TaxID=1008152 RepID=A0AAV3URX9_9EURY|nr:type IV secretion system DNA-binding domain-containing protein [Haladaptatus pallidirubidus]